MKQFLSFAHKEFLHIFRDGRTMLILLVMPMVLLLLFGYAVTTEVRGTRVTICDESLTPESRRLPEAIARNRYFDLLAPSRSLTECEQHLKSGYADVALYINREGRSLILCDASEPNQAQMRAAYLSETICRHGMNPANVEDAGNTMSVRLHTSLLFNPQQRSEYNFVPGVIGMIIILICAMMTSIAIVREKETGTMELLLASPLSPLTIIAAKLVPYFVVSSVNLVSILLISRFILGVPIAGSLAAFIGVTLLYIIVSLALGLLISSAVRTQMAALLLSLLLIVPTIYLSGFVFATESMPAPLQAVSNIVPATWYMDAARRLLIQGVEVKYVMKDFVILGLQAIVLTTISVKLFNKRLS